MQLRRFELEDQPWFPETIKESMTDYLRFLFHTFNLYHPAISILNNALEKSAAFHVIDLCSGSGGAIEKIRQGLQQEHQKNVRFILTDLYPRLEAYRYLAEHSGNWISYAGYPVDATCIPANLRGFRCMFSGIHHFSPNQVRDVLKDAIKANEGIALFDGGNKSVVMVLLILVFHPLAIFLGTPFLKPFRWSRVFFTYVVPIIPVSTMWDGVISIINLYKPSTLLTLAKQSSNGSYEWQSGKVRNRFGLSIAFLVGVPLR